MTLDLTKIAFSSDHPIDKIVHYEPDNTTSVVNDGVTSNSPQTAKIVTGSAANPYGTRCFVRARWSVDGGTSWQTLDSRLTFSFTITAPGPTVTTLTGLRAGLSIGVSDSTVHFRTANGYHGDVSDDGVTYSYTPTSQTFTIQYALFEKT
jgi:hypothetical protein